MKISKPELKKLIESVVKEQFDSYSSSSVEELFQDLSIKNQSDNIAIGYVTQSLIRDEKTIKLLLVLYLEPQKLLKGLITVYGEDMVKTVIKRGLQK